MKKHMPLKVGLVGFGRQGKTHFKTLQQFVLEGSIEVCGICDVMPDLGVTEAPFFTDASELILKTSPDVVIITVPNVFHFSIAKFALEHGCDVIKEKPLALSLEQGQQLLEIAKQHNRLLITAQQRFYQPLFTTLKLLLPAVGKVQRFSYVFTVNDNTKSWYWEKALAGGGSWLNMGWHAMAVLQWLFGQPEDVHVAWNVGGHRDWNYDTDHSSLAKIRYQDGKSGTIFVSCIYPKEESLKLTGEFGTLVLNRDGILLKDRFGKVSCLTRTQNDESYLQQYKTFFQAIKTRKYYSEKDLHILESIEQGTRSAEQTVLPQTQEKGVFYELTV